MDKNSSEGRFGKWVKSSITVRMLMVGVLILILLIPLEFIKDLIRERTNRQQEAMEEINKQWGEEVLIYGPVLKVPYKTYQEMQVYSEDAKVYRKEVTEIVKEAFFFPEKLDILSKVHPEKKYRGIYTTAVFKSKIDISGRFSKPDFSELEIEDKDIMWEKSRLIVQTTNLKGVNNQVTIDMNNTAYPFASKFQNPQLTGKSYKKLHRLESQHVHKDDLPIDDNVAFSLSINVNGSQQIRFIPIGKETTTQIISDWQNPSFFGEYLPYNPDKLHADGFDARWKVLAINRPFPQQYFDKLPDLRSYAYGVSFEIPVDEYTKSDRSTKYGLLVISLTFLVFFLIQTISGIQIHPFQYLMIGIALTMFYTLLLSISEHSNFLKAYMIAGAAVVTLISLYSKSILKGNKFPIFVGISLTALYTFIFVIIQLESYALLVGSIGLFLILALVMYASRKIDWHNG